MEKGGGQEGGSGGEGYSNEKGIGVGEGWKRGGGEDGQERGWKWGRGKEEVEI